MKLKRLAVKNFRGFKDREEIVIDDLTAVIGKNDVGKSTILEALDIFFGENLVKAEFDDLCINSQGESQFYIECYFECSPEMNIVVDDSAVTTLGEEYLIHSIQGESFLVIKKIFETKDGKIKKPKISFKSDHPVHSKFKSSLLLLKIEKLKEILEKNNIGCENKSVKKEIRKSIYNHFKSDYEIQTIDIEADKKDSEALNIFNFLSSYLPIYQLFRADREARDTDDQVQNPLSLSVKQAVEIYKEKFEDLSSLIRTHTEQVTQEVIEQMKESFPEIIDDKELRPELIEKKWEAMFKPTIKDENDLPMNKRGSGFRRLVLLSFLQNEAKKKKLKSAGERNVIYALEEPETFQHPSNQIEIYKTLEKLSQTDDQVIITTHNPAIAQLCPVNSIRYVVRDLNNLVKVKSSSIGGGNDEIKKEIANTLGVLPNPLDNIDNVKLIICVEGSSDIFALKHFSRLLFDAKKTNIDLSDGAKYLILPYAGDELKSWVEQDYLSSLNLPKFYLLDSDKKSETDLIDTAKRDHIDKLNSLSHHKAVSTRKREIENYLNWRTLKGMVNGDYSLFRDIENNYDFNDLTGKSGILKTFKNDICNSDVSLLNSELQSSIKSEKLSVKRTTNKFFIPQMNIDELLESCKYQKSGAEHYEIVEWFKAMDSLINEFENQLNLNNRRTA